MTQFIAKFAAALFLISGFVSPAWADHHESLLDLPGKWDVVATTDDGDLKFLWTITKSDKGLIVVSKNVADGEERTMNSIKVEKKVVTMKSDYEQAVITVVTEEKEAGKLIGKWTLAADGTEYSSGAVTATKVKVIGFAGTWDSISVLGNGNELKGVLALEGANDELKGGFESGIEMDKITTEEDSLRLEFDFEYQGNTIDTVVEAKLKGEDTLKGEWIVVNDAGEKQRSGDWSAKRRPDPFVGNWDVSATVPDSDDYKGKMTLVRKGDNYSGTSASADLDAEARNLKTVKVDGDLLEFTVDFERDGNVGLITVKAKREENSLKGTWSLADSDGNEFASDAWSAEKVKDSDTEDESSGLRGR